MTEKPQLAKEIKITSTTQGPTDRFHFEIDGKEFPWLIQDITLSPDPDMVPSILVRIPAKTVTSSYQIEKPTSND